MPSLAHLAILDPNRQALLRSWKRSNGHGPRMGPDMYRNTGSGPTRRRPEKAGKRSLVDSGVVHGNPSYIVRGSSLANSRIRWAESQLDDDCFIDLLDVSDPEISILAAHAVILPWAMSSYLRCEPVTELHPRMHER